MVVVVVVEVVVEEVVTLAVVKEGDGGRCTLPVQTLNCRRCTNLADETSQRWERGDFIRRRSLLQTGRYSDGRSPGEVKTTAAPAAVPPPMSHAVSEAAVSKRIPFRC